MPQPTQVAVILNASAGGGCNAELSTRIAAGFKAHGLNVAVTLAASADEMIEAAQSAVIEGVSVIAAGGGDGTMNAVGSLLLGTDIALGVLPLGTLNHLAKDLHIPLDLDEAIRTIAEGHSIKIDTGEINGRTFLNNSSLGLYPDAVRDRERQQRRLGRGKWLAFFWAAVTALRRYPFLDVTISMENQTYQRRSPLIFIGNNEYRMEGFNIGLRERLDGGRLSLYVVQRTGRVGLLVLAVRALMGQLRQVREFDMLLAKKILIKTHHKQIRVATDGEVTRMTTPLLYRICPATLKVIVPRNDTSTPGG
ncbi:diacylglycerol kinase family protein [Polaromonas sp.]|uniref:diacylglycerol/lipid kinase family protein n=1 Tax=Polaromonas sp. TaxID=1869339 RepID=UPI0018402210|nr:diacylglycerol kinase family protein [Polaromonas sp.]NML85404.1 diacylglycerol kinase family lipid kinase [Polaromonas sp.]